MGTDSIQQVLLGIPCKRRLERDIIEHHSVIWHSFASFASLR